MSDRSREREKRPAAGNGIDNHRRAERGRNERQRRDGIKEPRFDPAILKRPELVDDDVWPVKEKT